MKPHVSISLASLLFGALTLSAQTSSSGSNSSTPSGSNSSYQSPTTSSSANDHSTYGSASAASNRDSTASTTNASATDNKGEKLSMGDKHFITKTADDGQAEVQLAQLAADKATSSDVRSFAQKLVTDHTAVNQELATLAANKGVTLDNKGDKKDHTYNSLSKKSGMEFDRDFVDHMVSEHEKEIKAFNKVAKDAKDEDVRAFASKHVADLQNHLQIAQGLKASVQPTGRMDKNSGRSDNSNASTTSGSTESTTSGRSNASSSPSTGNGSTDDNSRRDTSR